MIYHIPSNMSDLPIYKKAMDIITLTRNISTYLNHDLAHLSENGKEDEHIYFSGDIVQQSSSLAPEILNAERERFSDKKHKHIASVENLTNSLFKNSYRLEKSNSDGKDFLPVLRRELRKFKKLQRSWMLTL